MSKRRIPNNTEIREINPNASIRNMMEKGLMPKEARFFIAGRTKILVVPPMNGNGWYLDFAREDRFPTMEEAMHISPFLLETGIQLTPELGNGREKDGAYHLRCRQPIKLESLPLVPEDPTQN